MDTTELHTRLMDDALRYDPAAHNRSLLAPYRDVLLLWRAKFMSYEQIAAVLTTHGLKTSPTAIGVFCRRTLTKSEIVRERHRLGTAATAPSSAGLSAVAKPAQAPVTAGRRGPRIARDNY